jgi:tryptophan synthase alpha chain
MGGDPDLGRSREYATACAAGGADVVEIGLPFSDPIADGPTIQAAAVRALERGTIPLEVLKVAGEVAAEASVPTAVMTYYNPIVALGEEKFASEAASAGVSGLIVPDLPLEESESLLEACRREGLDLIFLVTPATPSSRAAMIASKSSGFLYVVSRYGITGAREALTKDLGELVRRSKGAAKGLPVAVGFGISRPDHVRAVVDMGADAAVVGSAIVSRIAEGVPPGEVRSFVRSLRD